MAGTDNVNIQGIYDLNNVQDRLRKYAQDGEYFRFWALRQVNTITILKVISEKFGSVPMKDVKDWEFRYPEFDEIQRSFYLAELSSTTDATNTILKIADNDAAVLNDNVRLHVTGLFVKSTVADADTDTATARNVASGIVLPEVMRILEVGRSGSAGAGFTKVTVQRNFPADSYSNTAKAITTAMKITVSNIVVKANDFPKIPVSKNSKFLENYVQITRWSYGLGEHMTQGGGVETWLADGDGYLDIQYELAETFLMKTMELAILTGRKAKKVSGNDLEYETGGVLEFVPQDTDHYLSFENKAPSVLRINSMIRKMADTSGVRELWWFTGTELSEQIANAYENKSVYYTNAELSVKYRMKVKTLESVGRDLIVYHVTAPILNEIGMANEGIVLNLTEYNYNEKNPFGAFQVAHKVDFTDEPKDSPSYKSNEGYKGKWRELYGAWGFVRRLADTHFTTIGAPAAN